jgi:hypothetical protein
VLRSVVPPGPRSIVPETCASGKDYYTIRGAKLDSCGRNRLGVLVPVYRSDVGCSGLPLRPATLMHNSCTVRVVLTRLSNISSDLALRPLPWKLL